MDITGGCLCNSVRFRSPASPLAMRLCRCRLCQHLAAGNATVNVVFPNAAVTIDGALTDYRSVADSGNMMHRRFCPACGTHVFSASEGRKRHPSGPGSTKRCRVTQASHRRWPEVI